ncbi:MAG TPA: integrase arm-type DNA-binding domain-containing protein [Steroidobacteraceae bacterium]|nr:integrase arm-type DNA-binding domain-containing protein [Steroidobacteraceae bacterium]
MALTDIAIRKARTRERPYKLSDGRGLCLLVQPNGSKWWRFRYRWQGAERMLSLGTYPDTPLAEARSRLEVARQSLAKGIDPGEDRRGTKNSTDSTFQAIAQDYLAKLERQVLLNKRSASTLKKARWALQTFIYPELGRRPIVSITPQELLAALKKIEARGMAETARRTKQRCGQVFRHAVGLGHASRDITTELRGLLEPPIVEHHASITEPAAVGALLRAIDGYSGRDATLCALKLSALVFLRPGELRKARWSEIDFENAEWRVSARHMKRKVQHIVPLSRQSLAVLHDLKAITGYGPLLFPALGNPERCMSENTINQALRTMGYSSKDMTAHGFRSMASTLLNEQGWPPDAIERQLSHIEDDEVRGAYNYAQHLPIRRTMMQVWADYLDDLRAGRKRRPDTCVAQPRAEGAT